MATLPITLLGDNLGKRHQYLNNLVAQTFNSKVPFESIKDLPECTPVDRLFKIELASKYKNVDFLIQNLKDRDMLYVSRALKYLRILQDSDIFTPQYLEQELYPYMLTVATNKMKQLISLHLNHKDKCQQFYEYYKEENLKYALKFLPKCSAEHIVNNLEAIPFSDITPRLIRRLCENTTSSADVLFKTLKDKDLELRDGYYRKTSESFMMQLKFLLKSDPNKFFYLIENFYESRFKRLNKKMTKRIMKYHKEKFDAKSELYAANFLHIPTLSKFLNNNEIKALLTKLAKAAFLESFVFNYKFAEPLLKRMDKKEKSEFCKKIFEDKDFGELIHKSPYFIPTNKYKPSASEREVKYDHNLETMMMCSDMMFARSGPMCGGMRFCPFPRQTKLDKLFDQYRFKGFGKTFTEFKKFIPKESDLENRQNMFLVLISKTGGRADNLSTFMDFLIQKHANEPVSLRATVVRSLVKRACAWRMVPEVWNQLLKFGHDLGLDGGEPAASCTEGLHGVVLHEILRDGNLSPAILSVYLRHFMPLKDYSLTSDEKSRVVPYIVKILLNDAKANVEDAMKRFNEVFQTLEAHKLQVKQYPELISAIKDVASSNPEAYREVLERVFKLKVARQTFFKENFILRQTNESYLNALKIDIEILKHGEHFEKLLDVNGAKPLGQYLRKVHQYFGEEGGLAKRYLAAVKSKIGTENSKLNLARTLSLLVGSAKETQELLLLLENVDKKSQKQVVATLWANIHLVRPRTFIEFKDIKAQSNIATANYIQTCSPMLLMQHMPIILSDPRLARQTLALRGPTTKGLIAKTLPQAANNRYMRSLKIALRILRRDNDAYLQEDWIALKDLIESKNLESKNPSVYRNLSKIDDIPKQYKIEYCLMMYQAMSKAKLGSKNGPSYIMVSSIVPCLCDNLEKADSMRVKTILLDFLENQLSTSKLISAEYEYSRYVEGLIKIATKFILLSQSGAEFQSRINSIGRPFLDKLKQGWDNSDQLKTCLKTFIEPITDLKQSSHAPNELIVLIINFYEDVLPLNKNFEMNIKMKFTMLLSRAMKQCISEEPKLFQIENINSEDCMKTLGVTFAKILTEDLNSVVNKYFDSIAAIYSEVLRLFIYKLKSKWNNTTWVTFMTSLVKTMLVDQNKRYGPLLGALLYCKIEHRDANDDLKDLISKIDDDRIKLLCAHRVDINF